MFQVSAYRSKIRSVQNEKKRKMFKVIMPIKNVEEMLSVIKLSLQ